MAALGIFGIAFLLSIEPDPFSLRMLAVVIPTSLAAAVPFLLRQTASLELTGNIGASLAFLSMSFVAFQTGGLGKPILALQVLIPLLAVLVSGVRWGVFWTVLACIECAVLFHLHTLGYPFPNPPPVEMQDRINLFLTVALFVVVCALSSVYESLKNTALRHLERANRKLAQARDAAEEASERAEEATRARSAFLATMSHEIRTPMNAVIGMAQLLEGTSLTDEQRDFAVTIRQSGDSLLTILNDILDFSKIESGKLDIEQAPFDLQGTIEETLDLFAIKTEGTEVELLCETDPDLPRSIVGDTTRLRQVLLNLLSNAVKFTQAGEIHLRVESRKTDEGPYEIQFSVRDTGIGIPADRVETLFEAFTQVDTSTTRKYGGTGLGLAISQRLAELMGGRMWVESEEGVGSTFHFTLVAKRASDLASLSERQAARVLEQKKVLIVDDNATNRKILERVTQAWDMEPTSCDSGAEAVRLLLTPATFDVAILDMLMPEMDGAQLSRKIRAMKRRAKLPLVLLSSSGALLEESEDTEARARFAAALSKPVKTRQLSAVLCEVFGEKPKRKKKSAIDSLPSDMGEKHPLRILLAEDNRVNQKVALKILERLGYTAEVAENGAVAVEAVARETFDVVLMDLQMPEVDGVEATRQILERWPEDRPRVIALTANVLEEERQACRDVGMDDFLGKPLSVPALIKALGKCSRRPDPAAREVPGAAPASL